MFKISTEELLEGNKLIGEFWGYKHYPADKWYNLMARDEHYYIENINHEVYGNRPHRVALDKMRFHKSWDWLMPIIEKIERLAGEDNCYLYSFDSGKDWCSISTNDFKPKIITISASDTKIESYWKAIVQFLKIYETL